MKKSSKKVKILASVLGIVLGVTAVFAPACSVKGVDDTYINDNGELIIVYTDGTEKNLGVVKGEDGKDGANGLDGKDGANGVDGVDGKDGKDGLNGTDGKDGIDGVDGKDFTACAHEYGAWQTEIEATCTSIGYDTRTCSLCGDLDYRFNEAGSHNYDLETAVSVMGDCTERWVNASCKTCGDTTLKKVNNHHYYDENGVCTECGDITHFIESDEYIEETVIHTEHVWNVPAIVWWSIDRTYGLIITTGNPNSLFLAGYVGTPVHVKIPAYYNNSPLKDIGINGVCGDILGNDQNAFENCTTLKSIYIPETVERIHLCAFFGCTALEYVSLSENLVEIGLGAFYNCTSLTEIRIPPNYMFGIYDSMFNNCSSLLKIYIPKRIYDLGWVDEEQAFAGCSSDLEIIYYE